MYNSRPQPAVQLTIHYSASCGQDSLAGNSIPTIGTFHPTMPHGIMSLATTKIASNPISILKDLPADHSRHKTPEREERKEGEMEKEES